MASQEADASPEASERRVSRDASAASQEALRPRGRLRWSHQSQGLFGDVQEATPLEMGPPPLERREFS